MAKKGSIKKNNTETKNEVVEVIENVDTTNGVTDNNEVKTLNDDKIKVDNDSKQLDKCYVYPSLSQSFYMSELVAYEKALRMLCVQYEKMINIDEMENRYQITPNREKFMRLSSLHKRIMKTIENKALELEYYED